MRVFLAINPPAEVLRHAWEATASLREASPELAWVAEPKIHLTLKFLGAVDESAIPPLVESMRSIARTHAAPVVHVRDVGAFPSLRRPRVVWLGIEPEPRLELLHHDIEVACDKLGHELEGKAYRPHLTLGRARRPLGGEAIKRLRVAAGRIRFTDDFYARSIDVMETVPGPDGSRYHVLASAPLKGG